MAQAAYPKTRGIALSAVFASLLSISAQVSIPITPISPVPITLQVFIVYLAATIVGPRYGAVSCLLYLAIGAVGIPVFAGATGGVQVLAGPNGGYLFSFPLAVFVGGILSRRSRRGRSDVVRVSIAVAATLVIIYAVGVAWLSEVYLHGNFGDGILLGAIPFVPFDVVKGAVAIPISSRIRGSNLALPVGPNDMDG
jgi:biotin transport system substrate-specific component